MLMLTEHIKLGYERNRMEAHFFRSGKNKVTHWLQYLPELFLFGVLQIIPWLTDKETRLELQLLCL